MKEKKEKTKYKSIIGRTNFEKLRYLRGREEKELTERDSLLDITDYCTIIYNWLLLNKNVYTLAEYWEEEENKPFIFSVQEVEAENDTRINKLLKNRVIRDGLNKKLNATLAVAVLRNEYGWQIDGKGSDSGKDGKNEEITFELG